MKNEIYQIPHRRYNALTGEWLLLSPQRTSRPWDGDTSAGDKKSGNPYDSSCYLCPGNKRANGVFNEKYSGTYVFTNDFPALIPEQPLKKENEESLFQAETVSGTSRVICFSERHDLTLAEMKPFEIRNVIELWSNESKKLGKTYEWVQIFENKGGIMGCSNPHPHGQIWASSYTPELPHREDLQQKNYLEKTKKVLLQDYVNSELTRKERIVYENENWVCLVPYWATWPFETIVLPKFHIQYLDKLNDSHKEELSEAIKSLLVKYDNIFKTSFPYSMGWHGAPYNQQDNNHWQLHAHFYPPLLRSATVKKFMVGYEMMASAQRDITPETAAEMIRKQSTEHYLSKIDE